MRPQMSPKRRFLSAMMGGTPDRIPAGNVVSVISTELMDEVGASFPEVHLDAQAMAHLAAAGHEVPGFDTVMPVFSVTQEAEAIGGDVDWGSKDTNPTVRSHPWANSENLAIPDRWMEAPSIQTVLEAIGLLRKRMGDRVVIVGKAMGPWTLSYHMVGTEQFLMTTIAEPDAAKRSLSTLKAVTIEFAKAQMQAGADIICIADHPTGGMVSPLAYRDMLLPVHKEIVSEVGCPTVLHCCGNTTDRRSYFAEAGFDCYHFESQVDMKTAIEASAGKMTLMGNVNNIEVLLKGTSEQVVEACRKAISGGVDILAGVRVRWEPVSTLRHWWTLPRVRLLKQG